MRFRSEGVKLEAISMVIPIYPTPTTGLSQVSLQPQKFIVPSFAIIPFSIKMFRYKGLGHKELKKKRVSLVEKNVGITERFFDNHYNARKYTFMLNFSMIIIENQLGQMA